MFYCFLTKWSLLFEREREKDRESKQPKRQQEKGIKEIEDKMIELPDQFIVIYLAPILFVFSCLNL